jgi:hypothetical protein
MYGKRTKNDGVEITEAYEKQLINSMEVLRQQRISFNKKLEGELKVSCEIENDENFAMIIGYTSNGFPYGVTHEEMEEISSVNEIR